MWGWLVAPIDPTRAHEIGQAMAWHGRIMIVAWAILAPLAVMTARFFKIMPGQDWPHDLDNTIWWRSHWIGQSAVLFLTLIGMGLVLPIDRFSIHAVFGIAVGVGVLLQVLLGYFRGSKGGPTAPGPGGSMRGHHYDMTPWRRIFETLHKSLGYGLLLISIGAAVSGLWMANAPNWMWLALALWWIVLVILFIHLQRRGLAVDTYQAIWGNDPAHPGNRRPAPGWGVRRPGTAQERDGNVRDD